MEYKENEYPQRGHKPAKNHPWRRVLKADVVRWAKDKSEVTKENNFKVGRLPK